MTRWPRDGGAALNREAAEYRSRKVPQSAHHEAHRRRHIDRLAAMLQTSHDRVGHVVGTDGEGSFGQAFCHAGAHESGSYDHHVDAGAVKRVAESGRE